METSLDPTALLIRLDGEFGPRETPEDVLNLVPPPFTPAERPVITAHLQQGNVKDVENLPPVYISAPEKYLALQDRKANIGRFTREEYEAVRDATNPYEHLGRSIFMNRAGLKLANIDALYKLTNHLGAFMHLTTPLEFKFCDLAGAPGGFVEYIQWRRDEAMGYGISLKSTNPGVPTWNTKQLDNHRFLPYYGESDTGDLYLEWKNFVNRVRRDQVLGVDLVTGDGGFDVETERAQSRQEFLSFRLIMVQALTALKLLREGGNFVLKMFDTVTELSAQLLYIISLCFDKITLFKPISSRPANAEKYLVCQGKRKGTERYELLLEQANQIYNQDETLINIIAGELPDDFVTWLVEMNDALVANQQQAINWIFDYLEGKKPDIPNIDEHKPLIVWNVPGNPITKRSRIRIPGSGRGIPFSVSKDYS